MALRAEAVSKPEAASPAPTAAAASPTKLPADEPKQALTEARNREIAFALVDQAASALPALLTLCKTLEAELASTERRAQADLAAAEALASEWRNTASALQKKSDALEESLVASQQRVTFVEERAAGMQDLADQSRHRADEAESLSSLFHDKVVTTLGHGTPAYRVMETFRAVMNAPKTS